DTTKNTRIKEKYKLDAPPEPVETSSNSAAVQLARVKFDAQGNITLDLSERRSALNNPEATLTMRSLRLHSPNFQNKEWPTLTATVDNQMTLSSGLVVEKLRVNGDISLEGSLSIRTNSIEARVMAHENGFGGAPAGMVAGTKSNHPLSFVTNSASRLTILGD